MGRIKDDCVHKDVCIYLFLANAAESDWVPKHIQCLFRRCDCEGCKHYSSSISVPCISLQKVYAVKKCMPEYLQEQYQYLRNDITQFTVVRVSFDSNFGSTYKQVVLQDNSRNYMYFGSFFTFEEAIGEYLFYDEEDAKTALGEVKHNETC